MTAIRQTRIFVPLSVPFDRDTWAETVFGTIIKPTIKGSIKPQWFWVSRYYCPASADSGDCDITKIPISFAVPPNNDYRSVRFRYALDDSDAVAFESGLKMLISNNQCCISDCRDYDLVGDLGSDRHVGGNRTLARRGQRASIIVQLYHSISLLALDALDGPDQQGRFSFEYNNSPETPHNSSFDIPHHLFCNITEVPLSVLISQAGQVGTPIYPPPNPPFTSIRIRY